MRADTLGRQVQTQYDEGPQSKFKIINQEIIRVEPSQRSTFDNSEINKIRKSVISKDET